MVADGNRGDLMRNDVDDPTGGPKLPDEHHERRFHGFLEASPDAVVIIDGDGVIVQVNGQTEKLFGYSREELVGQALEMLMPERSRGSHVAKTRAYHANPQPRTFTACRSRNAIDEHIKD